MNARAILDYFSWRPTSDVKPVKPEFPPQAYAYDGPIDAEVVAKIQQQANVVLEKQQWTVIERLGDGR